MADIKTPAFELFYDKTKITQSIKPHLLELSYTDFLEGQSDEISVQFEDVEGKWIRDWFPTQGDSLKLQLGYIGEPLVDLGIFEIDDIEYSYPPSVMTIRALSTGVSKSNRTLKPRAYENTTLAAIVRDIARRLKLKVTGTVAHIPIKRATQYQERDVEFLSRLAREYHHSFKIVNDTLVFTAKRSLAEQAPVLTLLPSQIISIRIRDRIKETAKAVEMSAYDANGKRIIKKTKSGKPRRPSKKQAAQAAGDTLKIVSRGESQAQVDARAQAALDNASEDQQSGEINLIGNTKLVAGAMVQLKGFGLFSGKYLIKSSKHSLSRTSGFTTSIEVRMTEYIDDDQDKNQGQKKEVKNAKSHA